MERLTSTLGDRVVLALAVIGLIFAVMPASYVYPVDWVYEVITGKVIVDVTVGIFTYVFALALIALITVSYAATLWVTKKRLTALSLVLVVNFVVQLAAVLVYSGVL
jgi:hypothetical protein